MNNSGYADLSIDSLSKARDMMKEFQKRDWDPKEIEKRETLYREYCRLVLPKEVFEYIFKMDVVSE
jgi:hypothetical protein